nr:PREDICTED: maestro heat-like repeat-containing protein family member 7 [Anolis carolinensis]|eukprot:XP_008101697.1 PREDICTED: maestro heat-like repeat-containing protein family member 7 [Anolis carolinensis]
MAPETKVQGKTPSRLWNFHSCRANRDISVGDGESTRILWDCCKNCKINPHGAKPKEGKKQKPEQSCNMNRIEVPSIIPQTSAAITFTTDSILGTVMEASIDTLDSPTPSFLSVHSEQTSLLDVEVIMGIMEYAHSEEKTFTESNEENINFLRAVSATCLAALKNGQDTLDLPYTKAQLVEVVLMVMETLPCHSVPSFTLSCAMLAVYNLSKIKPPLDRELESCILRLALHGIFSMETEPENSHSQALYKSSSDTMETMLRGLLSEVPTTSHLLFILEHINFWIHSHDVQERSRAIKCSTSLLRHAIRIPDFEKSGELPALGHQVAQFGVCISDSMEEVSYSAREAIRYLYLLLLHQMGLSTGETGKLWCQTPENKKMLDYLDIRRVGELFGKIFTEDQKKTFLRTSLLATYDPLRRKSEAGILLVYSLLGKAEELMGDTSRVIEKKIYKQLFKLRTLREMPVALQSLIPNKGDGILEDKKN